MKEERVEASVLYVGCTRPATYMGVPLGFFMVNFVVTFVAFLALYKLQALLIFIPIHFLGKFITASEPRMLGHIWLSLNQKKKCPNRYFWKCSSYSPFGRTKIE